MSNLSTWSTSAGSNNSAAPDGFPEGQTPSSLNDCSRELMAAVRTQHEDAQWIDLGDTTTYASATTFTVTGDVTAQYDVGRRIRATDATTLYGVITVSNYSNPTTTVTVVLDAGSLSASLSAVSLGIISGTNSASNFNGDDRTKIDGLNAPVIGASATLTGTAVTFTGIPSWVTQVTVMISGATNTSASKFAYRLRIGDSGGLETTGYASSGILHTAAAITNAHTSAEGFSITGGGTVAMYGSVILTNITGNNWVMQSNMASDISVIHSGNSAGGKTLSSALTQISFQVAAGAFNAGTINIRYS